VKICIHRGASEIGGSCVEISTSTTKVLIDIGLQLYGEEAFLPSTSGVLDAVLISHPHMDHYGLIDCLSKNVPVYSGELSRRLIQASRLFTNKPLLEREFIHFKSWEVFEIGDLKITPYLVDHSAADAYAFLIEGHGKRVFYSGDFRGHGRKAKLFDKIISAPPKSIDTLLMEGTTIQRGQSEFPDEKSVEEFLLTKMRATESPCFLLCSSQNIDRLVSAYRACLRSERIFVVDIYTAWILKEVSTISERTPTIDWKKVRVLSKGRTAASHYKVVKSNQDYFDRFVFDLYRKDNGVTVMDLSENPSRYLIKNSYVEQIFKEIKCKQMTLFYSMWKGYLEEEFNPKGYERFQKMQESLNIDFRYVHSGGHAALDDLKRFADAIKPEILLPIHTEHAESFSEYFENVHLLRDGQVFELQ
jgi:ribonuclease J